MDEFDEPGWSRAEWAHWWLDHDEPDEAARSLEPGDEVAISRIDALDLAAALDRRGLGAAYESGVLFVSSRDEAPVEQSDRGQRRPPLRAPTPIGHAIHAGAKRSA
jgi:hypothetical protein